MTLRRSAVPIVTSSSAHIGTNSIGLITVAYGSDDVLPALFGSLDAASTLPVVAVLVDNARAESTKVLAEAAKFSYLPHPNRGYGAAVNAGVAALPPDVEWIVVTNPDVVFDEHAIDELLSAASADDQVAAAGPRVYDSNGDIYPSARQIPSIGMGVGHAVLGKLWPRNRWTSRYLNLAVRTDTRLRETGWLSGSCLLVRRSAFSSIGGFDEQYFMYFEDVDLGLRFQQAGWRSLYVPSASIHHIGGTSTSSVSSRMIREHHRSAGLFMRRRYPGPLFAPLRLLLRVGLWVRSTISRRRGQPRSH